MGDSPYIVGYTAGRESVHLLQKGDRYTEIHFVVLGWEPLNSGEYYRWTPVSRLFKTLDGAERFLYAQPDGPEDFHAIEGVYYPAHQKQVLAVEREASKILADIVSRDGDEGFDRYLSGYDKGVESGLSSIVKQKYLILPPGDVRTPMKEVFETLEGARLFVRFKMDDTQDPGVIGMVRYPPRQDSTVWPCSKCSKKYSSLTSASAMSSGGPYYCTRCAIHPGWWTDDS